MNKTLVIGLILFIVIIAGVLSFQLTRPISSNGPEIKLTTDKVITDHETINLIVVDNISPKGNNLTKIIIDEDDPNIMDESWKFAYYVCNEDEYSGWIYYYSGGDKAKPTLYGPYGWCLI